MLSLDIVQHRDLLSVRLGDLSLNYQLDRRGTQTITMILNEFDVADTTKVLRSDNTTGPLIPEVFSHIVCNPELNKRHNRHDTIMINLNEVPEQEEEEEKYGTPLN